MLTIALLLACSEDETVPIERTTDTFLAPGTDDPFQLARAAWPDTLDVTVDEVEISGDETDGWTYDQAGWLLHFHGDAAPPSGAVVEVDYAVDASRQVPEPTE